MNPLVIVPDEAAEMSGRTIEARLPAIVDLIRAGNLIGQIGKDELDVFSRLVESTCAHEMLLWARSERSYGVAWTSLAPQDEMVGTASADTEEGFVFRIFASGRTGLQTADELQAESWTNIEKRRGRTIVSMAGSPLFVAGKCAAALTLVQYEEEGCEASISQTDVTLLAAMASLLARSLEGNLIRASLGLKDL